MYLKLTCFMFLLLSVSGKQTTEDSSEDSNLEELTEDLSEDSNVEEIIEDLSDYLKLKELPEDLTVEELIENNYLENELDNTNNTDELFPHRIVGGQVIGISQVPYQVALLYQGALTCGGSIIRRSWILTAAHCIEGLNRSQLQVRAGSNVFRRGGQLRSVSRAIYHGRYGGQGLAFDIALLRLSTPLTYNARVQPVNLPSSSREQLPVAYAATGWGTLVDNGNNLSNRLRGVVLQAVNLRRCQNIYRRIGIPVNRRTFCTYTPNRDTCQGDSGGPMVAGFVIYGITSYGNGCARGIYPGVSTDVRYYLNWINRVIRRN